MTLVDTSVWIDHLREKVAGLSDLLMEGDVLVHPFVIGELACGNLSNRTEILSRLKSLPFARLGSDSEALLLIERRALMGKGLGYIDIHLLSSALLSEAALWTRDKRLSETARTLGAAYIE